MASKWRKDQDSEDEEKSPPKVVAKKKRGKKAESDDDEVETVEDTAIAFKKMLLTEKRVPEHLLSHKNPSFDGIWDLDLEKSDSIREMLKVAGMSKGARSKVCSDQLGVVSAGVVRLLCVYVWGFFFVLCGSWKP